jgi:hypothetical protein
LDSSGVTLEEEKIVLLGKNMIFFSSDLKLQEAEKLKLPLTTPVIR